jgi:hypothetical protein
MGWTTPAELKAQLARRWARGELPREAVRRAIALADQVSHPDDSLFPLKLVLKGPSSAELSDQFEAARAWAAALAAQPHLRIERRELRHRVQGTQQLPEQAWVDTLEDALALLGKRADAQRLSTLATLTRSELPAALPWLARRPLQALEYAEAWPRLLAVVAWIRAHPQPAVYLRQVDLPGVHSKFIEAHRAVLSELCQAARSSASVAQDDSPMDTGGGVSQFARRHGFLDKPTRIRFRVLDAGLRLLPGQQHRLPDITLDATSFAALELPVRRVFITENEVNLLAFPPTPGAIVLFGAGYGWASISDARWLAGCEIHYWGDIDTHGFAILNQLRSHFEHVQALLMDTPTLLAHEALWGEEPQQVTHDLPRLRPHERDTYDLLRDNRLRPRLRLEQERVGFARLCAALQHL